MQGEVAEPSQSVTEERKLGVGGRHPHPVKAAGLGKQMESDFEVARRPQLKQCEESLEQSGETSGKGLSNRNLGCGLRTGFT